MSKAAANRATYAHMVNSVRMTNRQRPTAEHLQRKGLTLSEIAARLGVPINAVQQTLYWDKVSR
jgi:DNA-directed RNA polymerase specialized sigma24 family protein